MVCGRLEHLEYLPPNGNGNGHGNGNGGYGKGPAGGVEQVPIVSQENELDAEGNYRYAYETGDGTKAEEQGRVSGEAVVAEGSFSFTAPDGTQYSISYIADENGFQPQGDHLPTPPPIPEEILKALEQNAADEAKGIVDDGLYRPPNGNGKNGNGYPKDGPKNGYKY